MGSRDRKSSPGILFVALRHGLEDSVFEGVDEVSTEQEEYLDAVSSMLQSIAVLVQQQSYGGLSRRVVADLLGSDCLKNLTRLAALAPPVGSYQEVLDDELLEEQEFVPLEYLG